MIGTPVQVIIRAIPKGSGWVNGFGEQYFDLTSLPWQDQQDIKNELDQQGFFTQEIYLQDSMNIQIGVELRKRLAAEQESKK